jgi:FdrA protein
VREARAIAARDGRELVVLGFVCGTEDDPQGLAAQTAKLREAGMILAGGSTAAARLAARVVSQRAS